MRCEDQCLRLRCGMQSAMPLLPSHDAPDRAYDRWACARHAQRNYAIKASGMAFAAYIVSVHAARLAVFFLMANLTFHQNIGFEIGKWGFADQAFFIHNFLRTIPIFLFYKLEFVIILYIFYLHLKLVLILLLLQLKLYNNLTNYN